MNAPFKIIVDSRNAAEGHSGKFLYQLPEVTHIGKDMVAYINQASVSNSFLRLAHMLDPKAIIFIGLSEYWIIILFSTVQRCLNRVMMLSPWRLRSKLL